MQDDRREHSQEPAPAAERDYRDLQRSALEHLLAMSTESVEKVEGPIVQKHRSAAKHAQHRLDRLTAKVEAYFRTRLDAARRKRDAQIQQIESVYTSDLKTLEANTASLRSRISNETDKAEHRARSDYDQEAWLSESVAQATKDQVAKELKLFRKELPNKVAVIDSLQEQADWLLYQYRQQPPAEAEVAPAEIPADEDPLAVFNRQIELVQEYFAKWMDQKLAGLFYGGRPYVLGTLCCVAAVGVAALLSAMQIPNWPSFLITGPVALALSLGLVLTTGRLLAPVAAARVRAIYVPLRQSLATARVALDRYSELTIQRLENRQKEALAKREQETQKARGTYDSAAMEIRQNRDSSLRKAEEAHVWLQREIEERHRTNRRQIDEEWEQAESVLQQRRAHALSAARRRYERETGEYQASYDAGRSDLLRRWGIALARIDAFLDQTARLDRRLLTDWDDACWRDWTPPSTFTSMVRFGSLEIDTGRLAPSVRELGGFGTERPDKFLAPAVLTLPERCSLLLQTGSEGREESLRLLQALMARLLTSLPPGRVRFTILDPIGLGKNFAGFMHLADYQDTLVDSRIWTESTHIEQRLADLTAHMENVIQKYLRNEFESIDAYNAQAGELAEPYRFLVIADFPANFTDESARRLSSIVSSGARCGVYTLIAHDTRQPLPVGIEIDDLKPRCTHMVYEHGSFVWHDEVLRQFRFIPDNPPPEEMLTQLMQVVGSRAREASRVEVPFEAITPPAERFWKGSSVQDLRVPVGRTGATRIQELRLGRGVAQHALIAGKTGSGKSTLLHVIITNLALWYSPDEVELYLIDFKKGVEFKTYVTHDLPHARAVAIESDREFGLSVLRRLDAEMNRRGDLFRRVEAQDLAAYRETTGTILPRTLLIVDEFQVFFSEDDKLAQDAAILLDRLVRQGRAFGIHVILGSQTLGGAASLARSTIGQMAVRVALQCSDADSRLILDDDNAAARLLARPGEAIYNDAGGLMTGNSPFQTAWLSDERRDEYLERVTAMAHERPGEREPLIVFEGNAPSDISKNRPLTRVLVAPSWPVSSAAPQVWLGDAVAIKDPTSVAFRRQSGANLLIVGQRDEAALAMMASAMISLAAQHTPRSAKFVILDGSPTDSAYVGHLQRVAAILPHVTRMVEYREVAEAMNELAGELGQRQQAGEPPAVSIYLLIYGLQRYRMLRRQEDNFSFSHGDEDKPPDPGRQFAELLREGPPHGIHTLVWSDTPVTLERTFDRPTMREFDNRVLFQMSAADSSNLIDSPAANKLGLHRALFHSEELGVLEQFRPYAIFSTAWLEYVESRLRNKTVSSGLGENVG